MKRLTGIFGSATSSHAGKDGVEGLVSASREAFAPDSEDEYTSEESDVEDEPLTKEELNSATTKVLSVVLSFCSSPDIFLKFYVLNKKIKRHFDIGKMLTDNIHFHIRENFNLRYLKRKRMFIKTLTVGNSKIGVESFKKMPLIKELHLFHAESVTDEVFEFLPCLDMVEIGVVSKGTRTKGFQKLNKISTFVVDKVFFPDKNLTVGSCVLGYMKYLKTLKIRCCNFTDEGFIHPHMSNVYNLELFKCPNLTDEIFRYFSNLQTLHLFQCDKIAVPGLKKYLTMPKLKEIMIEECRLITVDNWQDSFTHRDFAHIKLKLVEDDSDVEDDGEDGGGGEGKTRGWSLIREKLDRGKFESDEEEEES